MFKTSVTGFGKSFVHELAILLMDRTVESIHIAEEGSVQFIGFKLDGNDAVTYMTLRSVSSTDCEGEIRSITTDWSQRREDYRKSPVVSIDEGVGKTATSYKFWTQSGTPIEITVTHNGAEPAVLCDAGLHCRIFDGMLSVQHVPTVPLRQNFFAHNRQNKVA